MNKKIPWNTIIISIAIILGFVIASLILSKALITGSERIGERLYMGVISAGGHIATQVSNLPYTFQNLQ